MRSWELLSAEPTRKSSSPRGGVWFRRSARDARPARDGGSGRVPRLDPRSRSVAFARDAAGLHSFGCVRRNRFIWFLNSLTLWVHIHLEPESIKLRFTRQQTPNPSEESPSLPVVRTQLRSLSVIRECVVRTRPARVSEHAENPSPEPRVGPQPTPQSHPPLRVCACGIESRGESPHLGTTPWEADVGRRAEGPEALSSPGRHRRRPLVLSARLSPARPSSPGELRGRAVSRSPTPPSAALSRASLWEESRAAPPSPLPDPQAPAVRASSKPELSLRRQLGQISPPPVPRGRNLATPQPCLGHMEAVRGAGRARLLVPPSSALQERLGGGLICRRNLASLPLPRPPPRPAIRRGGPPITFVLFV